MIITTIIIIIVIIIILYSILLMSPRIPARPITARICARSCVKPQVYMGLESINGVRDQPPYISKPNSIYWVRE